MLRSYQQQHQQLLLARLSSDVVVTTYRSYLCCSRRALSVSVWEKSLSVTAIIIRNNRGYNNNNNNILIRNYHSIIKHYNNNNNCNSNIMMMRYHHNSHCYNCHNRYYPIIRRGIITSTNIVFRKQQYPTTRLYHYTTKIKTITNETTTNANTIMTTTKIINQSNNNINKQLNRKVLSYMGYGIIIITIPISIWWYWSRLERQKVLKEYEYIVEGRHQSPILQQDTLDYMITNKCLPGDILIFDRNCTKCSLSPWSAFNCIISKSLLCNNNTDEQRYDHIGIIVPGYNTNKTTDQYDPMNLLLLEATSSGIVIHNLKERIELSASRSILLLQLNCPGEIRNNQIINSNYDDNDDNNNSENDASIWAWFFNLFNNNNKMKIIKENIETNTIDSRQLSVIRTREHIDKELTLFRDIWLEMNQKYSYSMIHNTISIGGALLYTTGLYKYYKLGIISPSAFFVLNALQKSYVASSFNDVDTHAVKVEDYLHHNNNDTNAIRLRPGYRYLTPIPLKDQTRM